MKKKQIPRWIGIAGRVYADIRASLALVLALLFVPLVGGILIFCAEGKTRAIGLGLLVYSFSLFIVLPSLILAAGARRGSSSRLFASMACLFLSFFAYFYLHFTSVKQDMMVTLGVTLPISFLSIVFAGWWALDMFRDEEL